MIELMVVAGVIAILAGLLLPVLARAKSRAQSMVCVNAHRQLVLASMLYAGDYVDSFPNNLGISETKRTIADGTFRNWANNVMSWELDEDNTNTAWLNAGGIGPYLSGGVSMFRCPSDYTLSEVQRDAGWEARNRSMSMNAMVGNAGEFTQTGVNTNNPYYVQFFKLAQVPEPSRIFLFIDEHPDSIDDGYFLNKAYSREWTDLPASYHDGGTQLSFVDGHVESHRWAYATTKLPARPDVVPLPFAIPSAQQEDFNWLMEHMSYKRYAPKKK